MSDDADAQSSDDQVGPDQVELDLAGNPAPVPVEDPLPEAALVANAAPGRREPDPDAVTPADHPLGVVRPFPLTQPLPADTQ